MRTCETCGHTDDVNEDMLHCDVYDEWVDKDDTCPYHEEDPDWGEDD